MVDRSTSWLLGGAGKFDNTDISRAYSEIYETRRYANVACRLVNNLSVGLKDKM